MKNIALVLVFLMAACTSMKTAYDFDESADFALYKTYAFTQETIDDMEIDQLNAERLMKAVEAELALKGFSPSSTPDVLVDVHIKTQQRVEAVANTTGGGYRYGYYGYGGMGMSQTTINYNEYTDGSLFISLIDAKTEKLAWQGVGSKTIAEGISPEKREQNINYAVKMILAKYPPVKK